MRKLINSIFVLTILFTSSANAGYKEVHSAILQYKKGDYMQAFRSFKALADKGDIIAQRNLGLMYQQGKGVNRDNDKALHLFEMSAEKKNAAAQLNMGWIYQKGQGVNKDIDRAKSWYHKAAAQGSAEAQFILGNIYYEEEGDNALQKAYFWIYAANENGYPKNDALKLVGQDLSRTGKQTAKKLQTIVFGNVVNYQKIQTISPEAKTNYKIADLLNAGQTLMLTKQFIKPSYNNAHDKYSKVLRLDPNNKKAQDKLKEIDKYIFDELEILHDDDKYSMAYSYIRKVRPLVQDKPKLNDLEDDIRSDQRSYQEALTRNSRAVTPPLIF